MYDIFWKDGLPLSFPYTGAQDEDLGYFMSEVFLRSKSEGVRRVEQSRWKAIIQVALRAMGAEIYQNLPRSLQTIQNCPLESAGSCHAWLRMSCALVDDEALTLMLEMASVRRQAM